MQSDFIGPVNIGSEEMISINDYAQLIAQIAGKTLQIKNIPGPVGVRGRNSDNALAMEKIGWSPRLTLAEGTERLNSGVTNSTASAAAICARTRSY